MSRRSARIPAVIIAAVLVASASPVVADEAPAAPTVGDGALVEWGVGARLRWIAVPSGMLELFMADVASGVGHPGFGLEATRRKGDFEVTFGLEYESLAPADGFYREKGDGSVSAKTDFTEFDGFSWVTLDATFVFHRELAPKFALRYGAGLGLGIIAGEILQTDAVCTGDDIQNDCTAITGGGQVDDPADVPPVFPVVNLLVGGQYRPNPKTTINLELGLRTVFFVGLGGSYFF